MPSQIDIDIVQSTPVLSLRGYSIYPINDRFCAYFRESFNYIGTENTLDECLDMLTRHIFETRLIDPSKFYLRRSNAKRHGMIQEDYQLTQCIVCGQDMMQERDNIDHDTCSWLSVYGSTV